MPQPPASRCYAEGQRFEVSTRCLLGTTELQPPQLRTQVWSTQVCKHKSMSSVNRPSVCCRTLEEVVELRPPRRRYRMKKCMSRALSGRITASPIPFVHVRGLSVAAVVEATGRLWWSSTAWRAPDRCVSCGTREAVYIAEQQAFFDFSTSQRITRPTDADDPTSGNKVLLLSIQNPLYPITTVESSRASDSKCPTS
ncbi:heterogeneous nuclear ribonucleoprotein L-like protein [Lates japonicus]|uniref:Heterogeneous nuclear ribonucleoprotein L-like protein n=1 Tax=Lates japonicus TaxID=270547 RepID=A0AAD3N9D2_LATJO|nr:heterogeneous nuclear ribonucleoprotein L-like protein [Lates japonicus]